MAIPMPYILTVLLAGARLSALLMVAPVFGAQSAPAPLKAAMAMVLAVALFPPGSPPQAIPEDIFSLALLFGRELAVGALAGFSVSLVFQAVQMAGSMVGVQMGFGIAGVLDHTMQRLATPLEQLYNLLAALVFLALDLHHQVLLGMMRLFVTLPLGAWSLKPDGFSHLVQLFGGVLTAAVEMALPLVGVLLLTDLALGVIGRFIPQMNVFFVGMPVKIGVGLVVVALALPFLLMRMESLLGSAPLGMRFVLP